MASNFTGWGTSWGNSWGSISVTYYPADFIYSNSKVRYNFSVSINIPTLGVSRSTNSNSVSKPTNSISVLRDASFTSVSNKYTGAVSKAYENFTSFKSLTSKVVAKAKDYSVTTRVLSSYVITNDKLLVVSKYLYLYNAISVKGTYTASKPTCEQSVGHTYVSLTVSKPNVFIAGKSITSLVSPIRTI